MSNSVFPCVIAVVVVIWLFHSAREPFTPLPGIGTAAFADEQVAEVHGTQYVFTASEDGRKIFMWKRMGSKPPKFIGESDALLSE